jgi:hypothetical protein
MTFWGFVQVRVIFTHVGSDVQIGRLVRRGGLGQEGRPANRRRAFSPAGTLGHFLSAEKQTMSMHK